MTQPVPEQTGSTHAEAEAALAAMLPVAFALAEETMEECDSVDLACDEAEAPR